ncbi:MAG: undecaprenyl-diphosphate phosphatase [Campylobacterales bacterium]|nr:undecaprenyl-diphosphate phosphatase [Campylobacterales bacterium]
MEIYQAIILGILEGFTEFLPISSTGHLILASHLMGLEQNDAHKSFEIAIQLGSILSILFLFKQKLVESKDLWKKLIFAFLPTGILGFLFYKHIKELFSVSTVSYMLIIGGIIFIFMDKYSKNNPPKIDDVDEVSFKQAFLIGLFQSISMIPGTSRSGATIIGGLLLGLSKKSAAEFSFLLALPTMMIATFYDIYKNFHSFESNDFSTLIIGFVTAFIFALIAVKTFLAILKRVGFAPFGIYRVILGVLFLLIIT